MRWHSKGHHILLPQKEVHDVRLNSGIAVQSVVPNSRSLANGFHHQRTQPRLVHHAVFVSICSACDCPGTSGNPSAVHCLVLHLHPTTRRYGQDIPCWHAPLWNSERVASYRSDQVTSRCLPADPLEKEMVCAHINEHLSRGTGTRWSERTIACNNKSPAVQKPGTLIVDYRAKADIISYNVWGKSVVWLANSKSAFMSAFPNAKAQRICF